MSAPLAERDRLVDEINACLRMIAARSVEVSDALDEMKLAEAEIGEAYRNAARGTEGEAPEEVEARAELSQTRHARAERAVEEAYRAERLARGELAELYRSEREVFAEEAEQRTGTFIRWRTKAAKAVRKSMSEGAALERDALMLWTPLSNALGIEPPLISQVTAINNRAEQLARDVPRPAALEVDGAEEPVSDSLAPEAGSTQWIIYPHGLVDQADVGSPAWDRAVEAGAEITTPPPGAE
jgi:hypothetical protein